MTIPEFALAVVTVRRKYGGSVTRWGSSTEHSLKVGGFAGDPHTWDLGVDMVYDVGPHRPGSHGHPRSPHSCPLCSGDGLKVVHEEQPPHDHYQPMDMPAGPVASYAGQTKDWT